MHVRFRSAATSVAWLLPLPLLLLACGDTASPTVPLNPSPLATPVAVTTPAPAPPTPRPTPVVTAPPWPAGWDEEFCAAFSEVKVAQELVVDVPRALAEDESDDALGLARELRATALGARELIEEVPAWDRAQPALAELDRLADMGSRVGRFYVRFLDEGRRPARARAQDLAADMPPVVEEANSMLDDLAALGVECPQAALSLESP